MALIAMAVYDTAENKRTDFTRRTIDSLIETVDLEKHRFMVSDNGSCKETLDLYGEYTHWLGEDYVIYNGENLGTAEAINKIWKLRNPGEHAIKMDNDVTTEHIGWVEEMEEVIRRQPKIGQVGLKRKDCWEHPNHPDNFYKSNLAMTPHVAGEKWIVVELVNHVMGTCVMHSSDLLDKVGYLYQPKLYGFDDSFMSFRSRIAGFYNCFIPSINVEHIDPGTGDYQKWKEDHANECWKEYHYILKAYQDGKKDIYYNPFK